jgi:polar amino acid transport system substrate-binding protein
MGRGRTVGLLIGMLLPAALRAGGPAPQTFDVTTEELTPFSMMEEGRVTGLATDVLRTAFARAGLAMKIRLYPWLRAYQSALDKPNGCVYSTVRTPERDSLFKWVGPIASDDWVVFVAPGSTVRIADLADLRRYKTAGTPGDSVATYLQDQGVTVEYTPTTGQMQMLLSGRIDFWATTQARGAYFAAHQHVKLKPVLTSAPFRHVSGLQPRGPRRGDRQPQPRPAGDGGGRHDGAPRQRLSVITPRGCAPRRAA